MYCPSTKFYFTISAIDRLYCYFWLFKGSLTDVNCVTSAEYNWENNNHKFFPRLTNVTDFGFHETSWISEETTKSSEETPRVRNLCNRRFRDWGRRGNYFEIRSGEAPPWGRNPMTRCEIETAKISLDSSPQSDNDTNLGEHFRAYTSEVLFSAELQFNGKDHTIWYLHNNKI